MRVYLFFVSSVLFFFSSVFSIMRFEAVLEKDPVYEYTKIFFMDTTYTMTLKANEGTKEAFFYKHNLKPGQYGITIETKSRYNNQAFEKKAIQKGYIVVEGSEIMRVHGFYKGSDYCAGLFEVGYINYVGELIYEKRAQLERRKSIDKKYSGFTEQDYLDNPFLFNGGYGFDYEGTQNFINDLNFMSSADWDMKLFDINQALGLPHHTSGSSVNRYNSSNSSNCVQLCNERWLGCNKASRTRPILDEFGSQRKSWDVSDCDTERDLCNARCQ